MHASHGKFTTTSSLSVPLVTPGRFEFLASELPLHRSVYEIASTCLGMKIGLSVTSRKRICNMVMPFRSMGWEMAPGYAHKFLNTMELFLTYFAA
ncbi:Hypothetical protein NTJ_07149 [Nesidiocoris tenuis]|uniref:Uncharacterized protein n=1 Tax=Nesidiocoris tenuis TaxID=355587 RepID=A0ABN7AQ60_9HEMI|nr:Hypothetical protein NTJ_07149 [Nesidiocoris tenuis]